jgi:hypothetical protein
MQDHQALKTIWTEIVNIFRTEFFEDQEVGKKQQLKHSRLPSRVASSKFQCQILCSQKLERRRGLIARLQPTAVAETLSWFYLNESGGQKLFGVI